MKQFLALLLIGLLLAGCAGPALQEEPKIYEASFLTLFDTITTIKGAAESKEAFSETSQRIHDELLHYHQLFDVYNDYEGLNNLKTVNDQAGIGPVEVDSAIIALLKDCRTYYDLTGGKVNVAMGSVLHLWHEARNHGINDIANAKLPDMAALEEAAEHVSFDSILIDEEASTVFITDPSVRLDVGAVAKGWAAQKVAEKSPAGLLISVGGNVCATGPKLEDGTPWVIGIQDPDSSNYLHTLYVSGGSVVTSGDYQRFITVDGVRYHHLIDPATLMPATHLRAVTVVCESGFQADFFSTVLFLLPFEEGMELVQKTPGMEALFILADGSIVLSPGLEEMALSHGASAR